MNQKLALIKMTGAQEEADHIPRRVGLIYHLIHKEKFQQ